MQNAAESGAPDFRWRMPATPHVWANFMGLGFGGWFVQGFQGLICCALAEADHIHTPWNHAMLHDLSAEAEWRGKWAASQVAVGERLESLAGGAEPPFGSLAWFG